MKINKKFVEEFQRKLKNLLRILMFEAKNGDGELILAIASGSLNETLLQMLFSFEKKNCCYSF